MFKHKLCYLIGVVLLAASCISQGVNRNQPNDKAEAVSVVSKYFYEINNQSSLENIASSISIFAWKILLARIVSRFFNGKMKLFY